MFPQKVEVFIGIKFGCFVDIMLKSDVPQVFPKEIRKTLEPVLIGELLKIIELSQEKFDAKLYEGELPKQRIQGDYILVSSSIIFENERKMFGFLEEMKNKK